MSLLLRASTDEPVLYLTEDNLNKMRDRVEAGEPLYWEFQGMWGKVPNPVLRNCLERYDRHLAWAEAEDRDPIGYVAIRWDQVVTPQEPPG